MSSISAIMAVRDGAPYLRAALDSMLSQSTPASEVIVVDDGSTDETPAILESYGDRIRTIRQPNAGQGSAVAAGLKVATGELVVFNDADDLWTPGKTEKQLAVLADPEMEAVFGNSEQFVSPELDPEEQARLVPPVDILVGEIAQAMLARRVTIDRFGGIDPSTRGAWFVDWLSRAKGGGMRSIMLPEIVHLRRLHPANYGRLHTEERNLHHLRALRGSVLRSRAR